MFIKKIIKFYKNNCSIPYQALADAGESNRLAVMVVVSILLLLDIFDYIFLFSIHHAHLHEQLHYLIYLCIYTPYNIFIYFLAKRTKNSKYQIKTISVYLLLSVGLSAAVFNFYFMASPHNGYLTYIISGFLFLIVFSFSPIIYFLEMLVTVLILIPGVYKSFGIFSVLDAILITIIFLVLSLFKRRNEKKLVALIKKQKKSLVAKTFGNFTLMYEDKVIKFSRTKSTELLAYLIYKNGSSVRTKELLSILYGDNADSEHYGSNFRNLIVDIRHSLASLEIQDFFIKEYNNFRINPESIKCDFYDFLAGDSVAVKSFAGEFMNQYDWAEETVGFLEMKLLKKK